MVLHALRCTLCFWLYSIIAICLPAFSTVRAVNSKDIELMKEQLTYWTVNAILGCIELICRIFGVYQNTPPEFRIVLMLWLTQPQWGGSHQIYTLFVKPVFEVYEDDIDRSVQKYSGKFWSLVIRQFRSLVWHIAFAEEDGIIPGLLAFLGQAHKIQDILRSWGASTLAPPLSTISSNMNSTKSVKGGNRKQKYLLEFLELMRDELVVKAGYTRGNLKLCHMSVKYNSNFLYLQGINTRRTSLEASSSLRITHHFSFARFSSLSQDDLDPSILILNSIPGSVMKKEERIFLSLGGPEECEGLMFGLEIAIMNSRSLLSQALETVFELKNKLIEENSLYIAFEKMKKMKTCKLNKNTVDSICHND